MKRKMYDPIIIYLKAEKVNNFQQNVFIYLKCRKVDPLFSSKPCITWVWLKLAASRDSVVSRNVYLSVVNKYNTCNSHVNGVTCHYNTSQCKTYTSPSLTMSRCGFRGGVRGVRPLKFAKHMFHHHRHWERQAVQKYSIVITMNSFYQHIQLFLCFLMYCNTFRLQLTSNVEELKQQWFPVDHEKEKLDYLMYQKRSEQEKMIVRILSRLFVIRLLSAQICRWF